MKLFQLAVALVAAASSVNAAPANPNSKVYPQPDGSETPEIFVRGNQLYRWMEDEKGFTIVRDDQGWYNYGIKTEDGDIVPSGIKVGSKNPKKAGIAPGLKHADHMRPDNHLGSMHQESVQEHRSLLHVPENALCGFAGTKDQPCKLRGLVFLVQFSDHGNRQLPSPTEYDILFNNDGPDDAICPSGSVNDVFMENSYGAFKMESTISDWIKVPRSEEYAVHGNSGLNMPQTRETWKLAIGMCDMNDEGVCPFNLDDYDADKDNKFDCVVILHSGSAAEAGGVDCENDKDLTGRIWSHATAYPIYITNSNIRVNRFYVASGLWDTCAPGGAGTKWDIARVAVIAHECAHFLGLPDLYDTQGGQGLGSFELQANMWGWYGNQYFPPLMGAWSKLKLGWSNVIHVKGEGTHYFKLGAACDVADTLYIDHRLDDGEYFLVEYRFPCGFDSELKHHAGWQKDRTGAAIWHVDESGQQPITYQTEGKQGQDSQHYVVALVQSDGGFHMETEIAQGGNRGDRYDLFMHCPDYSCGKAYKIDNTGVTSPTGHKSQPSTKGYARGSDYDTGISIEVGSYAGAMDVTIVLVGQDTAENTYPGPDEVGTSPGDVPTPSPVPPPTPAPVPPTPAPVPPTPAPVPPTPAPVPPTPQPTESKFVGNIDYKHDEVEHEGEWETRIKSLSVLSGADVAEYIRHYDVTLNPAHHIGLTGENAFDPNTSTLLNVPIDCTGRDNQLSVSYTGVGNNAKSKRKTKTKYCSWFINNNEKFCPLVDMDPDRVQTDPATGATVRPRIWQTCHNECEEYTHCSNKN